jgi:hypothetical protein
LSFKIKKKLHFISHLVHIIFVVIDGCYISVKFQSVCVLCSRDFLDTLIKITVSQSACFLISLMIKPCFVVITCDPMCKCLLFSSVFNFSLFSFKGHILQSPSANVLPTLPFHVLRSLFSATPLTTDDGVLLRRMALEIGALHLILVCLSALSHHAPRVPNSSLSQTEVDFIPIL